MIQQAIELINREFKDFKDKGGKPYVGHLMRVYKNVENEDDDIKCIALLHDTIEDIAEITEDFLVLNFNPRIAKTVKILTHEENQSYDDYITKILSNNDAIKVKLADLKDNMDITRLDNLKEKDFERLKKYLNAYKRLTFK